MKNKVFAGVILSAIFLVILGVVLYLILSTNQSIVFKVRQDNNNNLPILLSFSYPEYENYQNTDNLETDAQKTDSTSVEKNVGKKKAENIVSMLLLLNLSTHKVGVLEIPGYLGIHILKDKTVFTVESVFKDKGYKEYLALISKYFGIEDLGYIYVDYSNIEKFIDLLGGLQIFIIGEEEISVDREIRGYTDGIGDAYFDGPGVAQYLQIIEQKRNNNELTKSSKRKELVLAMLKQIQLEKDSYKSNAIINAIYKHIDTSLSAKNLQEVFSGLSEYNLDQLYFQRITGQMQTVDIPNKNKEIESLDILFSNSEVGNFVQVVKALESKLSLELSGKSEGEVSVTILNGTVVNGLASSTRPLYEESGFKVLSVGNADVYQENSIVIDRIGNKVNARKVADVIGIKSIITDFTSVDSYGADITVILGRDFNGKKVQ